jgi:hypothetical protein
MMKAMPGYWDLDRCAWVVPDAAAATTPSGVRAAAGTDPEGVPVMPEQREEPDPTTATAPASANAPARGPT